MGVPGSSEEVIALAKENHPTWTQGQIDSYVVGYFDSMLDNRARIEQERIEELLNKRKPDGKRQ